MGDFTALNAAGIRVRLVKDLGEVAIWMPNHSMLLIESTLSGEHQQRVADVTLTRAGQHAA